MQNQTQEKKLYMEGSSVFMFTMDMVPKCVNGLLKKANKEIDDIDLFVFHQASKLVIDSIIRRLDLPENKVFTNYQNVGNTVVRNYTDCLVRYSQGQRFKEWLPSDASWFWCWVFLGWLHCPVGP